MNVHLIIDIMSRYVEEGVRVCNGNVWNKVQSPMCTSDRTQLPKTSHCTVAFTD